MLKQFIILSLATSLLFTACESSLNREEQISDPSENIMDTQSSTHDEDSNDQLWSTYTSEAYGFSINFPSNWRVEEDPHGRPYVYFTSPERTEGQEDDPVMIDARIITYTSAEDLPNNDKSLSFENWIKTEDKYFDGEATASKVGDINAYLVRGIGVAGKPYEFFMVEHAGKIYELNLNASASSDYIEEREQMFTSFRFITSSNEEMDFTSSCSEEACFMENFKTCAAATMSSDLGFVAVHYEILGEANGGCEVKMVYIKNPNPAWADQPIICTLDTYEDFLTAWQKKFEAAVEGYGDCTGALTEILQN